MSITITEIQSDGSRVSRLLNEFIAATKKNDIAIPAKLAKETMKDFYKENRELLLRAQMEYHFPGCLGRIGRRKKCKY